MNAPAPRTADAEARESARRAEIIVRAAFAPLDLRALLVALAVLCALALWGATAILLLKGAPPGREVGPHLALLAHYLPGYSVTWPGSVVGLAYGLLIGAVLGGMFGVAWNVTHAAYVMLANMRNFFADGL